jgi:mannose-6-phosphate isomerase-like protein (cupin superfamily)
VPCARTAGQPRALPAPAASTTQRTARSTAAAFESPCSTTSEEIVPPPIHTREDEFSIVLEGEIGFRSEDQEVVLAPGGYIVKVRGQVHAMWNARRAPARVIEVISPAGFEGFFRSLTGMTTAGRPDPEAVGALAQAYGLPFAEPDWLPDVIARYGLTPPVR